MTRANWTRVTDVFSEVLESGNSGEELLALEPEEVSREVRRLLAAHNSLEANKPGSQLERQGNQQSGRILAGRYRLEYLLGAGGSGEAWLSQDLTGGGGQVVVKIPHTWDWFRHDLKRRFLVEAEALQRISHPAVVTILDSGETEDGAPFLVMPFIDGQPLRTLLDVGPLPTEVSAWICEALGAAIQAAHQHDIIHRDIKPENVLVQLRDGTRQVFLIDFGIALFGELEQQSSTTTRFFGTTQYMAPEQLLGKPAAASDLYAFALLVYEMAAGKPLFEANTPAALYERQRKLGESDFAALISPSLRRLLCAALRADPRKRPSDVEEFGRKVASALRSPGRLYLPSRRKLIAGAMVAVPVAGWAAWRYRPVLDSEKSVNYQGGETFRDIGWKTWGVIDSDIVEMDAKRERYTGNRLRSRSQGGYFYPFSVPAQRRALERAWRLTALLRPVHGFCNISLFLKDFDIRFSLGLIAPDTAAPRIQLTKVIHPRLEGIEAPLELPQTGEFVPVELRYDPVRREVAAWLRGQKVLDGYRGCTQYVGVSGVVAGVGQNQSELGEGVVGDIHFEMG
jgi:serine/threonine protein kinase